MSLGDKLRTLQAQAGHASPSTTPAHGLRAQLQRLIGRGERRLQRPALAAPAGVEIAPGVSYVEQRAHCDCPEWVRLPWGEPDVVARERLVCFDTETTGLAGGVGTKAFMIGASRWSGGLLLTRQAYLTALAGEAAMLALFRDWLDEDSILVSYNGRSYDAPLLKGRYRIHRLAHPFETRRHVDLLHPVRRAYRGRWINCRLATVERELLGIVREDDLPGAEAPAAWLAFLRGESSRNLARVITHNQQDLRSLAALIAHMGAAGDPED